MTIKLALIGPARAGKDMAAGYLALKYGFQPYALADRGKALLHELFPTIPRSPKPRRAYQQFIDGVTRLDVDGAEDVWIDGTLRQIESYLKSASCPTCTTFLPRVIITDVRKQREYDVLKSEGFKFIRIHADDSTRFKRMEAAGDVVNASDLLHRTETEQAGFQADYTAENNGSMNELEARLDEIMAEVIAE